MGSIADKVLWRSVTLELSDSKPSLSSSAPLPFISTKKHAINMMQHYGIGTLDCLKLIFDHRGLVLALTDFITRCTMVATRSRRGSPCVQHIRIVLNMQDFASTRRYDILCGLCANVVASILYPDLQSLQSLQIIAHQPMLGKIFGLLSDRVGIQKNLDISWPFPEEFMDITSQRFPLSLCKYPHFIISSTSSSCCLTPMLFARNIPDLWLLPPKGTHFRISNANITRPVPIDKISHFLNFCIIFRLCIQTVDLRDGDGSSLLELLRHKLSYIDDIRIAQLRAESARERLDFLHTVMKSRTALKSLMIGASNNDGENLDLLKLVTSNTSLQIFAWHRLNPDSTSAEEDHKLLSLLLHSNSLRIVGLSHHKHTLPSRAIQFRWYIRASSLPDNAHRRTGLDWIEFDALNTSNLKPFGKDWDLDMSVVSENMKQNRVVFVAHQSILFSWQQNFYKSLCSSILLFHRVEK
jgi:hypothetical protein